MRIIAGAADVAHRDMEGDGLRRVDRIDHIGGLEGTVQSVAAGLLVEVRLQ